MNVSTGTMDGTIVGAWALTVSTGNARSSVSFRVRIASMVSSSSGLLMLRMTVT